MTRWIILPIAFGLALAFLATLRRLWSEGRSLAAARKTSLSLAAPLLDNPRITEEPSGFPRLTGLWQGQPVELRLIPDSLSYRKLPALWLSVTLGTPLPLGGEMRILARASGLETFTPFADLPQPIALPAGFPPECSLRATGPAALPPTAVMQALASGFADPAWKEAVLSDKGLRLVILAEEAARTPYLIYREAALGRRPVPAALIRTALERLSNLSELTRNG